MSKEYLTNDGRYFCHAEIEKTKRTCMLMVTHGCNLNCTYCYEKFKSPHKNMSVEMAKNIILEESEIFKRDKQLKPELQGLEIEFMGGEPLLRFDLIKEVVEWLEEGAIDIPFICYATTNGTLLNESMKEWFRKHKETMVLGASFDGVSQAVNRGNRAQTIDLDFFDKTWPFQGFKMTISKESLPYLYESYVYASQKNYKIFATLAHGVDWNINDAELLYNQLTKLKDYYLSHLEYTPLNMLTRPLAGIGKESVQQKRVCGSGVNMATYDVDGTMYGCHLFTPVVMGMKAVRHCDVSDWINPVNYTDSACIGCMLSSWCPTCIGFNLLSRGDVAKRDHRWCAMLMANAIVACKFQLEYFMIMSKKGDLTENEAWVLKCALTAYKFLQNADYCRSFPQ